MNNVQQVVGIAFIENNRILIVQSRKSKKTNSYTLIGGGVEEGETILEAATREVKEEIHNGFTIKPSELKLVMTKQEVAVSDPNKMINMHLFIAHKSIDVELIPNDEILEYHWYKIGEDYHISNSIKDFLEYALKNNILSKES